MTHQQRHNLKMTAYEEMGIAALLPGMVHLHELMGRAIEEVRASLARVQDRKQALAGGYEHPVLKTKGAKLATAQGRYWAAMTPEERSAEMKRRGMVGRSKKAKTKTGKIPGLHPRDPRHPGHAAWKKKLSKRSKASWANATPEEHAARVAKTLAGRAA